MYEKIRYRRYRMLRLLSAALYARALAWCSLSVRAKLW